jgi:5-oxoprolinase (ATP-hydrolysing)
MPNILYEHVIEVEERVITHMNSCSDGSQKRIVETNNKEKVEIMTELNLNKLEVDLNELLVKHKIRNLAVVLVHSYIYQEHEILVGKLAARLGFDNISLSHQIMPMIRMVPRGLTTCVDAYLTPHIKKYINNFVSGFQNQNVNVLFMQSDGGLTSINK